VIGADHFARIFKALEGETMVAASDEAAGERTVAAIVDAIARARSRTGRSTTAATDPRNALAFPAYKP
jgi:hypothetical protein